jgi:tetratricopeptide (TPR) repeat protein
MVHEQAGEIPLARNAYDRLLGMDPRNAPALNNAAYLYAFRLGQIDKGLELARRARDRAPADPLIADTLGWILHLRGDYPAALALLQESAKLLPTEAEVLFHLGMTHYMLGEEKPARLYVERALQSKRASFTNTDEAERTVALIKLDPAVANPEVLALLEKRLTERPDDPVAALRLSSLLLSRGEADRAIRICEQALKANPNAVRLLVQLAEMYSRHRRDPKRAIEYAQEARKLAPEDPLVAYSLGRVAFESQDHGWAYSLLQDAARKRPDHGEVLVSAGWAAYSVGQLAESESLMQRALRLPGGVVSSNDVRRFLSMYALYLDPSKIPGATAQLQQALTANPADVPTLMVAGLAHQQRKSLDNARKAYERVLTLYPEFAPAMKLLAGIYTEQGTDDRRAFELASKARETLSGDPDLSRTLGILAYRRGDFANGIRLLGQVALHRTNDAAVFFHLGMAQHRLKAMPESQRALRRMLELDSNSPFADEARRVLADSKR